MSRKRERARDFRRRCEEEACEFHAVWIFLKSFFLFTSLSHEHGSRSSTVLRSSSKEQISAIFLFPGSLCFCPGICKGAAVFIQAAEQFVDRRVGKSVAMLRQLAIGKEAHRDQPHVQGGRVGHSALLIF